MKKLYQYTNKNEVRKELKLIALKAREIRSVDKREMYIRKELGKRNINYFVATRCNGGSCIVRETKTELRLFMQAGWGRWNYSWAFIVKIGIWQ